ncbi:uncharacterized protein LOC131849538 [Achroia grisella]|uniref:uncharacterized protein LOC131849538 n=1 Tax=Achroia grisella TaxID=688607 RepID=UPI0027D2BF9E|nr:uncharacterized protein LOC131849538 [Achroia grisella]
MYRILAYSMTYLAMGHQESWGFEKIKNKIEYLAFKINTNLILIFAPMTLVSQIINILFNYSKLSFDSITSIFVLIPVATLINIQLLTAQTKKYKSITERFFRHFHLCHIKDQNNFVKKITVETELYIRIAVGSFIILTLTDGALWVISPAITSLKYKDLIINNKTRTFETSIHLWYPFDYLHNYRNWQMVHSLNVYLVANASSIIAFANGIYACIIFHLIGHIKILKYKISSQKWDGLNNLEVKKTLTDIIKYHIFVKEIKNDIQDVFGISVCGGYGTNLFVDSLVLYQIMEGSKESAPVYVVLGIVLILQIVTVSIIIEQIPMESEDLPSIVYNIPWEDMSVPNKKHVLLMLTMSQTPMQIIMPGGLRAGVRLMISVFKTTFSYYVMLKQSK